MTYKAAVLFDLDGTLVDTAADFVAVLNQMRQNDGLPPLDDKLIRNTVSDGARALVTLAYALREGDAGFEDKRQELLNRYEQELGKAAHLFTGFEPLLKQLEAQNIGWGIVTNKPWRFTEPLLQRLQLKPSNDVAICPDHVTRTKPDAEPLLLAASKLGLGKQHCLYAGDHERDIQAGRNANMHTIACGYGYIHPEHNIHDWQADTVVHSVEELNAFLNHYFNNA